MNKEVLHTASVDQIVVNIREAMRLTSLSRSTIIRMVAEGSFVQPIRLSTRRLGFLRSDLFDWVDERRKQSRKAA